MHRVSLTMRVLCIVAAVCGIAAMVFEHQKKTTMWNAHYRDVINLAEVGITDLKTAEDLDRMRADERAVVFVDVEWSLDAVTARPIVARLSAIMNARSPGSGITFYRLDLTEQSGPTWNAAEKWLRGCTGCGNVMAGGYGTVLWVSHGRPIEVAFSANDHSASELASMTRRVFGL